MPRRRDRGLWVLAAFFPFGMATWAGFAWAGKRAHVRRWKVYALVYALASYGALTLSSLTHEDNGDNSVAGFAILIPWIVGAAHALIIRPDYVRRVNAPGPIEKARERLEQRDEALRLAREDPRLALEVGVGRPDRRGAMDAGLVDVNNAPVDVIERLPGIDRALARRIVAVREELDGFDSLEDFGMTMDLSGDEVEDLRDKTVFLPR